MSSLASRLTIAVEGKMDVIQECAPMCARGLNSNTHHTLIPTRAWSVHHMLAWNYACLWQVKQRCYYAHQLVKATTKN